MVHSGAQNCNYTGERLLETTAVPSRGEPRTTANLRMGECTSVKGAGRGGGAGLRRIARV